MVSLDGLCEYPALEQLLGLLEITCSHNGCAERVLLPLLGVHVVSCEHRPAGWKPCGWPACPESGAKRCAKCGRIRYCCAEHQRAHWPSHRPSCRSKTSQRGGGEAEAEAKAEAEAEAAAEAKAEAEVEAAAARSRAVAEAESAASRRRAQANASNRTAVAAGAEADRRRAQAAARSNREAAAQPPRAELRAPAGPPNSDWTRPSATVARPPSLAQRFGSALVTGCACALKLVGLALKLAWEVVDMLPDPRRVHELQWSLGIAEAWDSLPELPRRHTWLRWFCILVTLYALGAEDAAFIRYLVRCRLHVLVDFELSEQLRLESERTAAAGELAGDVLAAALRTRTAEMTPVSEAAAALMSGLAAHACEALAGALAGSVLVGDGSGGKARAGERKDIYSGKAGLAFDPERDPAISERYFKLAAAQGHPQAESLLAVISVVKKTMAGKLNSENAESMMKTLLLARDVAFGGSFDDDDDDDF
ncbi:hypothetical protein T492DRAFT_1135097 [Pavlovales sp. CCMP2436]|nr:hypothetical protein T492DRAFT_1135097 [Pavlovales sp. CCMP2436]